MFYGLGLLLAGAVLQRPIQAQVVRDTIPKKDTTKIAVPVPARADSLLRDTLAVKAMKDSLRRLDSLRRADTIKAPLAHAEIPIDLGIARKWHWDRDSLFRTGAITVADLLDRVPGITTFHAGWLAAPAIAGYLGDVRRIRMFIDGVERIPLDPRAGATLDLTQINLWSAEELTIEQAPEEVRVYMRTWRVRSTTSETRTDVNTGDQQTNMYRGFFGRRYTNGLALQFGAQQFGTQPPSALGTSSDQTGIIGRVGWAKGSLSVDAYLDRVSRHRGTIYHDVIADNTATPNDSILNVNSSRSDMYLRVGMADPDTSRLWWQAIASTAKYDFTGVRTQLINAPKTPADTAFNNVSLDTSNVRSQYVFSVGTVRGPLRLSASERLIGGGGKSFSVPSVRASFVAQRFALSALGEGKSYDSVAHMDVSGQFMPTSYLAVTGGVGRASDDRVKDSTFSATYIRAEAGLRFRQLWFLGGVIRRDSVRLSPPAIFNSATADSVFRPRGDVAANGITAAIRGKLWRILYADLSAVRWNDTTGLYRPRYQTRSELSVRTNMLDNIPTGHLGIMASLVHEYRSSTNFPVGDTVTVAPGYRTLSTLLEIRILNATISWQFRNFLGEKYQQVPGLIMPRQTNFYGVRWTFYN